MNFVVPDQTIHLPRELRELLANLLIQSTQQEETGLSALAAILDSENAQTSYRDDVLISLLAARYLAPRELSSQARLVEGLLQGHITGVVLQGSTWDFTKDENAQKFFRLLSLPEGIKGWAERKELSSRKTALLILLVGLMDLGFHYTSGNSVVFDDHERQAEVFERRSEPEVIIFIESSDETQGGDSSGNRAIELSPNEHLRYIITLPQRTAEVFDSRVRQTLNPERRDPPKSGTNALGTS